MVKELRHYAYSTLLTSVSNEKLLESDESWMANNFSSQALIAVLQNDIPIDVSHLQKREQQG